MEAAQTSILSIGSGDGSQQAAIVRKGHRNICVTFYDSRDELLGKYPSAQTYLNLFETAGIEHHFSVSAASVGETFGGRRKFDVVMFYFPHVGGNILERAVLQASRQLIRDFLAGASKVLAKGGEIQLAVKVGNAYSALDVRSLFGSHSLAVAHQLPVDKSQFPGYVHRLTKGTNGSVHDPGSQLYVLKAEGSISPGEPIADLVALGAQICAYVIAENGGQATTTHASMEQGCQATIARTPTDDEVGEMLVEALGDVPPGQQPTVLDLRAAISHHLDIEPEVSRTNRVLYKLEAEGKVLRTPPLANGRVSQKPTWRLTPATKVPSTKRKCARRS
jgi:hypothetical protein